MEKFIRITGLVAPLDRANVDTDAIIPKQYLKSINKSGFGVNLFDAWRYLDNGEPGVNLNSRPINPEFILNKQEYFGSTILIARDNFGCGSSREHAPWALVDYGFRVVIAPSFADIFYNNSLKNGLLPVALSSQIVDSIFKEIAATPGYSLTVDLDGKFVETGSRERYSFEIDAFRRDCLLKGLDDIGITLGYSDEIKEFEMKQKLEQPWLYQ